MKRQHYKNRNYHHLTPRSRRRAPYHGDRDYNVILLKVDKHVMLHQIFGNRTLEEIIKVLQRLAVRKHRGI
jgi:hypothetical protein